MEKLYEIREYQDGGPNDSGSLIGYAYANSKTHAKQKYADAYNCPAIMGQGFVQTFRIKVSDYMAKLHAAQRELEVFNLIK